MPGSLWTGETTIRLAFLSYLVASLRTLEEEFGEAVLAALRSPEPPRSEALIAALVNEIATLASGLDLVLDDYHLIDSEGVHRIVSFMLERLPDGAHLVVSGRVDPPLPLARLRARGQMAELGAVDLTFTEEEAGSFLKGVMDLDPSAEDVAKLEGRTEGWIAGSAAGGTFHARPRKRLWLRRELLGHQPRRAGFPCRGSLGDVNPKP